MRTKRPEVTGFIAFLTVCSHMYVNNAGLKKKKKKKEKKKKF